MQMYVCIKFKIVGDLPFFIKLFGGYLEFYFLVSLLDFLHLCVVVVAVFIIEDAELRALFSIPFVVLLCFPLDILQTG